MILLRKEVKNTLKNYKNSRRNKDEQKNE